MKQKSFSELCCPVAGALDAIGDRWTLLLVRDLTAGPRRYDDFRRRTGIPPTTLSSRLRHLESSGVVERVRYQNNPPRDDYRLTDKGRDLWNVIDALREWGERWDTSGTLVPVTAVDRDSGHRLELALVDTTTGSAVPRDRVAYRAGAVPAEVEI